MDAIILGKVFENGKNMNDSDKKSTTKIFWVFPINTNAQNAILGMCRAPGRNYLETNAKLKHENLISDVANFKKQGVNVVICLLNKYELRYIGIDLQTYQDQCKIHNIEFMLFPIVEMAPPEQSPQEIDDKLLTQLCQKIQKREKMIIHCRGGVGRAGTIVALILLKMGLFENSKTAIEYLRKVRHPKCVESYRQEQYVFNFEKYIKNNIVFQK